ncbi:carboxylesterase family protein [Colletotrichum sojae]|uniref:Carboxylesterase family protein n=1 Tax=Colletotrichum sojae TaxID=2175907 RepID=A0A8H6ITP4_9PEZI|nr:carboxylesterase family protein [Colletotrichum sojae]
MTRLTLLTALSVCAMASGLVPRQALPSNDTGAAPAVQVKNGSYYGVYSQSYDQDFFLGIPYAQPPVDSLRFRVPQSLNTTWEGTRNATEYSPQCFGYGSDTWVLGNYVSEDCLTINVVRPHGVSPDAKLPVAVWIHGGGLTNGGSSDPRYNVSFIVEQSVRMGTPFIAASINYRLHAWGFLWSDEIKAAGVGNLGFRDQRLALQWVNENIAAFGGDPKQVTLWSESAGSRSVGTQMLAYGGRDDGLYRAAILQSGTGLETDFGEVEPASNTWQDYYNTLVNKTNCAAAADTLDCLRGLPAWDLSDIINGTASPSFNGMADGDFLEAPRSELINAGKFVKVPILIGANFDEGTQFGQKGISTTEQWESYLRAQGANNVTIEVLSALYPDIPRVGLPATLDGRPTGADATTLGSMYKRAVAFGGDRAQHGPRRYWARKWAEANQTVYSYHFNVLVNGMTPADGAKHFQEVVFVFNNTDAVGYKTAVAVDPFEGKPDTFKDLANIMSRMWVAFITKGDPNQSGVTNVAWPKYDLENPENMAFDVNVTSIAYVEPDTYRTEQIEYLIQKLWT